LIGCIAPFSFTLRPFSVRFADYRCDFPTDRRAG